MSEELTIQYQLSNGRWIEAGDKADRLLADAVEVNDLDSIGEAKELLKGGKTLRHDPSDWYSNIRAKPDPVPYRPLPSFENSTGICSRCGYGHYECDCP